MSCSPSLNFRFLVCTRRSPGRAAGAARGSVTAQHTSQRPPTGRCGAVTARTARTRHSISPMCRLRPGHTQPFSFQPFPPPASVSSPLRAELAVQAEPKSRVACACHLLATRDGLLALSHPSSDSPHDLGAQGPRRSPRGGGASSCSNTQRCRSEEGSHRIREGPCGL